MNWIAPDWPAPGNVRALSTTRDGGILRSGVYQAEGEPEEPVTLPWIVDKFHWLTRDVLPRERADALIGLLTSPADDPPIGRLLELLR